MPITSFVVTTQIQGMTLAIIATPLAAFLLLTSKKAWSTAIYGALFIVTFFVFAQTIIESVGTLQALELRTIETDTQSLSLRKTFFTQTLYFIPCLIIFAYFREFFREEFFRYVLWGAWLLVIYGYYEWIYFFVFGETGDFVVNRVNVRGDEEKFGSSSQLMMLGPKILMRLKSFTGEPSFFAISAVPYLALAIAQRQQLLSILLAGSLLLSFSTSAFIGGILAVLFHVYFTGRFNAKNAVSLGFLVLSLLAIALLFPEQLDKMFLQKFSGQNDSGQERSSYTLYALEYFSMLPWLAKFTGIGLGTTYLPATLRVLLDLGFIGLIIYLFFFLRPIFMLGTSNNDAALRASLLSLLVLYTIACEEIFTPTTWMLLGIAYYLLDLRKIKKLEMQRYLHQLRMTHQKSATPGSQNIIERGEVQL